MPNRNSSSPKSKKSKKWLVIALAVAAPFAIWGGTEAVYQVKLNKFTSAVNEIGRKAAEPAGGVAVGTYIKAPRFVDSLLCIDSGPCPSVTRSWAVLVDEKEESSFIHEALKKAGYQDVTDNTSGPGANSGATKGGITIKAGFYPISGQPPYQAPAGKEWRSFDVTAH